MRCGVAGARRVVRRAFFAWKGSRDMTRLEKIARRQLRRARVYREAGDADGESFAMHWYRRTQARIERALDAAFGPRIDLEVLA